MREEGKGLSRRAFLTGAGAVGALAGLGALTGAPVQARAAGEDPVMAVPDVPSSLIRETIYTDVVVVGAGDGGVAAAASANEQGVDVICLSNLKTFVGNGGGFGGFGSKYQQVAAAAGTLLYEDPTSMQWYPLTAQAFIKGIRREGAFWPDQRVISRFVNDGGPVFDWADGVIKQMSGGSVSLPASKNPPPSNSVGTSHNLSNGNRNFGVIGFLMRYAEQIGVDFRWEHEAVQLVRDDGGKGRVTSVIAKTSDGYYVKFRARKGIILCSGGYAGNMDLLKKFQPTTGALAASISQRPMANTGNMIKAAMAIGATMDPWPGLSNMFDGGMDDLAPEIGGRMPINRQPWLFVNIQGERFTNEDMTLYGWRCHQMLAQTNHRYYSVFDSKWETDGARFSGEGCAQMKGHQYHIEIFNKAVEQGLAYKSDTLEGLAAKIGCPVDTFKATVARYNDLYAQYCTADAMAHPNTIFEPDMGKQANYLTSITQGPFYAMADRPTSLGTLTGLRINAALQCLDADGQPIPGLWAAGNDSGSFFANCYPFQFTAITTGRAMVFGRLAAIAAAKATV